MKLTTKLAYKVFPPGLWSMIMSEVPFTLCRWGNVLLPQRRLAIHRLRRMRRLKVHLGCGTRSVAGWVNVDALAFPGVTLRLDCRYSLPFQSASARMIYTEHHLEHFHKDDAERLLRECYRVLEPGGRIRIGVPDAEIYLRAYAAQRNEFFRGLQHLGGAQTALTMPLDVINQMFRMGGHHLFAWDMSTLEAAMKSADFADVARWAPGRASSEEICLDDPAHAFETLYVEASRPRGNATL